MSQSASDSPQSSLEDSLTSEQVYGNYKFGLQPFVVIATDRGFLVGYGDYHREFIGCFSAEELAKFFTEYLLPQRGREKIMQPPNLTSTIELDIEL